MLHKSFERFLICGFVLFTAVTIVSCGSESQTEGNDNAGEEDTVIVPETKTNTVSYSLPSPLQIASIFKKSGLVYMDGITNSASNVSNYSSNDSKALNLGVYSSDLAYCVLNKQSQSSINYLKASKQLANQLGLGSVFEMNSLSTRFENNLSNEDSLMVIIAELQMQTDLFLEENEQEYISAVVFAGAWIESMFIGTQVYEKTKDKKVTIRVIEQMTILDNIIEVLKAYESKGNVSGTIVSDLVSVKQLYDNFQSVKKSTEEELSELEPTEEEISSLSEKIKEIRTKLINP